ncbi:MAG TPA: hypothetical protein VGF21_13595 [Thermoleophilaceae bacterium]
MNAKAVLLLVFEAALALAATGFGCIAVIASLDDTADLSVLGVLIGVVALVLAVVSYAKSPSYHVAIFGLVFLSAALSGLDWHLAWT